MIYAYIRVSTPDQSYSSQEYEIRKWAEKQRLSVDKWIREAVSGTLPPAKRKLGSVIRKMKPGDLLVCAEISRLGRNMLMIMSILNDCSARRISIHTIKDHFDLSNNLNSKIIAFAFALAAEIERNLISQRTREALADRKAAGVRLGRPPGSSRKKEVFERNLPEIRAMLAAGASRQQVAAHYGIHRSTLTIYLESAD